MEIRHAAPSDEEACNRFYNGNYNLHRRPQQWLSPEAKPLRGLYISYLAYFKRRDYRCKLPSEVAQLLAA